ncbi:MAG: BlaI/MecI/CopY family transcriptional regulator [Bryobacterales bacterium]|nr:BlaI/MecI/CopY family transcriptional regulator [Bryobacterales bacterium]
MASRTAKGGATAAGEIPPPLELACLTVLWKRGEADAGEVREAMRDTRPLAYTTVMTVLERLAAKGMATRQKSGRSFRYAPARERDEIRALAVAQLVEQFFDGSVAEFERYYRAITGGDGASQTEARRADPSHSAPKAPEATAPPVPTATLDETLL